MTRFYQSLGASGKRQALRQAQLKTRERFDHPYYWAAFQLTGAAD
jgi:CHAT domain-containing protein